MHATRALLGAQLLSLSLSLTFSPEEYWDASIQQQSIDADTGRKWGKG